ncbi:MAG: RluA family pseudouridine synthase [Oscillospiraceae bacterium]
MERILRFTAEARQKGRTLRQIMEKEYGMSVSLIRRMKRREGAVLVDGVPQFLSFKLSEGEKITLIIDDGSSFSETIVPKSHPLSIVFEDEDILLVNKPAHLPCHPVKSNREDSLSNYLAALFASRGENFTARIINRLDSNTSGLVLFAKNALAASILNERSDPPRLIKEYTAITAGIPPQKSGEITANIRRRAGSALLRETCESGEGQTAVTLFQVLETDPARNFALLRLRTLTGRTHQIRVHLSQLGCPLVGDFLYGEENRELITRHALHLGELQIIHPLTKAKLHFSAPLAEDMQSLWKAEQ